MSFLNGKKKCFCNDEEMKFPLYSYKSICPVTWPFYNGEI